MNQEGMDKKISKLVAKAWADAKFKAELMANTNDILKKEGIEIPEGITVTAVENTKEQFYFIIPPKPDELSDEELGGVSGGYCMGCGYSGCQCYTPDPNKPKQPLPVYCLPCR